MLMHIMHAFTNSWPEYTNNYYNQKTMDSFLEIHFSFPIQDQEWMRNNEWEKWMKEWTKWWETLNKEWTLKHPNSGFIYLLRNQEPHGLSPRISCNHFPRLESIWVHILKILSHFSPLSHGIISPHNSCPWCILLFAMFKVLHFLGTLAHFNCWGTLVFH
jgi:hypothetical protein